MTHRHDMDFLVQRYMDGQATADETARLNQALRTDISARKRFVEILNLDSALAAATSGWHAVAECQPAPVARPAEKSQRGIAGWHGALATVVVAACLALVAVGMSLLVRPANFATVGSTAGVDGLRAGMVVGGESYSLAAGTVELTTPLGARIVIEAPAQFRFESLQRLHLLAGRLAADVPPAAKGFTVVTPTGRAVDLGTKFGIDVPPQGEAEIHVFQGEVVGQPSAGGASRNLRDGEAFLLSARAGPVLGFRSGAFIQPGEVASLDAALRAGQQARSEQASARLRLDPSLIGLMDFEGDADYPGVFRHVQGRWPGSQAAEFVDVGDHMKLDAGGERSWQQISLAAWVRLDHLGEPYQSLLHTDGWSAANTGQVHWMVTRHATMRLALRGNVLAPDSREDEGHPDSRTSVLPEQGRWAHLAAVYDAGAATVRFYLNGRFDSETRLEVAHPARLGPAQIGNWNRNDRKLSGRVDELLILGRAMNDAEVQALFAAGNPYR